MNGDLLQNMAPNAKRSFFITIALVAITVIIYMFCVQPADAKLGKDRRSLSELQDRQYRMTTELRRADMVKKDLDEVTAALKPYHEALLAPLLESYSMRAKSLLDPLAFGAGLSNVNYTDDDFRALPLPKPLPRQLHTRAAIRMTANGSYQEAISFLLRLEKEFPLVSLQRLTINAQTDPETQEIIFVLEWPAKGGVTRK